MWELAVLIATVVGAVHFVHRYAFKEGRAVGITVGRKQILEENIKRLPVNAEFPQEIIDMVDQIVDNELPKIKYVPKEGKHVH